MNNRLVHCNLFEITVYIKVIVFNGKKKVLIVFSSVDGQTLKICNYIKKILIEKNIETCIRSIDENYKIDTDYNFVLIAASVRYGNYKSIVYKFIDNNLEKLCQLTSGFLSVNATARKKNKDSAELDMYFQKLRLKTNWHPTFSTTIAGAIKYPQYHFFDRIMIQFIMYLTDGPTDSSKSIEFTNWAKVDHFAHEISSFLNENI